MYCFLKPNQKTTWWFQAFFIFTPKIGEDEPNLTHIFSGGLAETTNQKKRLEESFALVERLLEDLLKSAESPTQLESLPKIPGVFKDRTIGEF